MLLRTSQERYNGNIIAAAPGTHAAVVRMVAKYCSPDQSILDLGAYTGALIDRLNDRGFAKTTAADLDNHLTKTGIRHVKCDFNKEFSADFSGSSFKCIIVSEVIEHLDDPRGFLRQCASLIEDDGIIVLSTPNVGFFEGRFKFFLKGELWGFGGYNYRVQRHISPLTREQFPLLLEETGFEILELFTAASFATPLRRLLTSPLWVPMRWMFGPFVVGESVICVGRRKVGSKGNFQSDNLWSKQAR